MIKETKKAPTIRFRDFTDDWEQRKLSDVAERVTRKNKNLESTLPLTISAQYGLIDQNEFFDKRIASKDVSGYYLIRKGEFAYNKSTSNDAPWGAIKRLNRYESGVLSTLYIVFCILDKSKTCSDYLASYYDTNLWHKEVKNIAAEGARNHGLLNIAPADFFETKLMIPKNFEEQQMIGEYFSNLDHLITLHQRKLDQLKTLKKYFLQNMFTAKGEKVPRIRFKGFTGDWEQRKLVDIATMHARIGWQNLRTSEFLDDGDYYLITGTDFKDGRIDFSSCHYVAKERYDQDKNIQIHNGSILITKDGTLGKVAYISGLNKPATLNAGVFNVVIKANDVDEKYLYHYLAGPFLMDYVSKRATGGTIKHLNQNILVDFPVVLPSYDEQKKIGETLQDLDNLITLHQRKLDQLQTMKKFMLQNMFI